jgi:hypothetical protein
MRRYNLALALMVFLTLLGMVGLYYGLWRAQKLLQEKQDEFKKSPLNSILGLIG